MTAEALPGARSIRLRIDRWDWTGWKFALPGLSVIAIVMGFPLIYAVLLAISSFTLLHPRLSPFVGWENFATVMDDEYFWHSVWLTIQYSSFTVIGEFLLGLSRCPDAQSRGAAEGDLFRHPHHSDGDVAGQRGADLAHAAATEPWHRQPSARNGRTPGFRLARRYEPCLLDCGVRRRLAAGLVRHPYSCGGPCLLAEEPYEAAAGQTALASFQQFWYLTLPMLRPDCSYCHRSSSSSTSSRTYDLVYVLTKGGPGIATDLLSYFAYKRAFLGLGHQ